MHVLETIGQFHVAFDFQINQIGISNNKCLNIKVDLWYWQEIVIVEGEVIDEGL